MLNFEKDACGLTLIFWVGKGEGHKSYSQKVSLMPYLKFEGFWSQN